MSLTTFETFCKKHPEESADATVLRQGIADKGLAIFSAQQVEAILGKPTSGLIDALVADGLIAEVPGFRHEACEFDQWHAGSKTGDQKAICEGCGKVIEDEIPETRYQWKGTTPEKTPTKEKADNATIYNNQFNAPATVYQGNTTVNAHDEGNRAAGQAEKPLWERIVAVACGFGFIVTMLVIAIAVPKPSDFQYTIFRIVLALAAGGLVGTFSGFLDVRLSNWLKAGGGLAVFVIVFFYSPAQLVSQEQSKVPAVPPAVSGGKHRLN